MDNKFLVNGKIEELDIKFFSDYGGDLYGVFTDEALKEDPVTMDFDATFECGAYEVEVYKYSLETFEKWGKRIEILKKIKDLDEGIKGYENVGWASGFLTEYGKKSYEVKDWVLGNDIDDCLNSYLTVAQKVLEKIKKREKMLDEIDTVGMDSITDEMLDEIWESRPDDFDPDYNHYCFYDHKWYSFYLSTFGKGNKFLGIPEENAEDFYFSAFRDRAKDIYFTAMKDDLGNYYENFEVFFDRIFNKIESYVSKFHKLPENIFDEKKDEFKEDMNEIMQENHDKFEEEEDCDRPEIYHHKLFETWDKFFDENIEEEEE